MISSGFPALVFLAVITCSILSLGTLWVALDVLGENMFQHLLGTATALSPGLFKLLCYSFHILQTILHVGLKSSLKNKLAHLSWDSDVFLCSAWYFWSFWCALAPLDLPEGRTAAEKGELVCVWLGILGVLQWAVKLFLEASTQQGPGWSCYHPVGVKWRGTHCFPPYLKLGSIHL